MDKEQYEFEGGEGEQPAGDAPAEEKKDEEKKEPEYSGEELTLTTMDGEEVKVPREIGCKSKLILGIYEESGCDEDIPLPAIKKEILDKVLVYCK